MHLSAGMRLGPYEIETLLGAGGMGEVYRARDQRLARTVALKVLTPAVAARFESRQRFEREARAVAALQHPNICAIYDIGRELEMDFLVMEFLSGEPLSSRLSRGPLPLDQVFQFGIEIAAALDVAHRQGIVHRDLKPSNIMLVKSGSQTIAKLLDFGLAKTRALGEPNDETLTGALTTGGSILGTFQYIAPEQLSNRAVDGRADLFSLGAVLYEMLTARRAFDGQSQAEVIAQIMTAPAPKLPAELHEIEPSKAGALERLIHTCLAKDPEERWQTARDVLRELRWIAGVSSQNTTFTTVAVPSRFGWRWKRWTGVAGWLAAAVFMGLWLAGGRAVWEPRQPARLMLEGPPAAVFSAPDIGGPITISPDGRSVAFVARENVGPWQLWVRPMESETARALPGTEEASMPFWSPDSKQLGFFAGGKMKRIVVAGGRPEVICDVPLGRGATWSRSGVILFAPTTFAPLMRVDAAGGTPVRITEIDRAQGIDSHRSPVFLPDGRSYLYFQRSQKAETRGIYLGRLDSNEKKFVLKSDSAVGFAPAANGWPAHLLYMRQGTLLAQPFDVGRSALTGNAVAVADHVAVAGIICVGDFSVSNNGIVAYRTGASTTTSQLVWFDRSGKALGVLGPPTLYRQPSLSPDGLRVAVERPDFVSGEGDIWILDSVRSQETRFTIDPAWDRLPLWSPSGDSIAYLSQANGRWGVYRKPANGEGEAQRLFESPTLKWPTDWSRDGRWILYDDLQQQTRYDIYMLAADGSHPPRPLVQDQGDDRHGQFSPNGRFLAYSSNASGRWEVFVQPLSGEGKWQISMAGGDQPRWNPSGREIFYINLSGQLMAVPVRADGAFQHGAAEPLFNTSIPAYIQGWRYSVSPDGQRFLVNTGQTETPSNFVHVLLNWPALLPKQ